MSVKVYGKMWLATVDDINDVMLREKVTQQMQPETDRLVAHGIFANLYARYVMIVNRLGDIYDQTLQVQKRACVRRILETSTLRLIELQKELKSIEMSEFMYLDQTLIEEKLRPNQVQLLCPFYYPMLRPKEMQDVVDGVRKPPPVVVAGSDEEVEKKTPLQLMIEEKARLDALAVVKETPWDKAVKLIKIHEKARQARCLYTYIQMHPDIYSPQPPETEPPKAYHFYHKPDQPMLIPVKRTVYESNFFKSLRTYSHVKFYESPARQAEKLVEKVEEVNEDDQDVEEIVIDTESDQFEYLQMLELEREKAERKRIRNEAATKIQRCFLRWRIKRLARKTKFQRFVRIGMADERRWDYSERERIATQRLSNKMRKEAFDEAFRAACEDTKARIVKFRSPWIMEDISDHIRFWFREMYDVGGEMDKFPPAAKGGTIMVLNGLTPTPGEFVEFIKKRNAMAAMKPEQRKKILEDEKKKKDAEKLKIKEAKKKKALEKKQKQKLALKQGKTWEFNDEEFITKNYLKLDEEFNTQQRDWRFIDEFANIKSDPYQDWIDEDKYAELHVELRAVVDDLMRVEYELLRMAWSKDNKKKYKAPKAPKERKKGKGTKKGKKPEKLDFGERDMESVYDTFLESGVISHYPERRMDDYIGDRNYCAYEMRNYYDTDPWHFMGEVKDVLRQYMLGMGDIQIKHPKSLCIMGPPGCGKKFMVDAMANEMGVIKFDLSPEIVVKFKDNLSKFFDDVLKMAKLMQPSMLFIKGAHNPFIKKILPEDQANEPKLSAKYLPKMLKKFKPHDRIMLVATTNQPWNCAVAKLKKTFEVILLSNGSDYSSTLLTWRSALLAMEGIDRLIDLSALTKVTKFYGTKQMIDTANTVVDIKRRVFLERRPLQTKDLLNHLLAGPEPTNYPMTEADQMKYQKVFQKVNKLAKSRVSYRAAKNKPKKK